MYNIPGRGSRCPAFYLTVKGAYNMKVTFKTGTGEAVCFRHAVMRATMGQAVNTLVSQTGQNHCVDCLRLKATDKSKRMADKASTDQGET